MPKKQNINYHHCPKSAPLSMHGNISYLYMFSYIQWILKAKFCPGHIMTDLNLFIFRKMYTEFKQFAVEDAIAGYRYYWIYFITS